MAEKYPGGSRESPDDERSDSSRQTPHCEDGPSSDDSEPADQDQTGGTERPLTLSDQEEAKLSEELDKATVNEEEPSKSDLHGAAKEEQVFPLKRDKNQVYFEGTRRQNKNKDRRKGRQQRNIIPLEAPQLGFNEHRRYGGSSSPTNKWESKGGADLFRKAPRHMRQEELLKEQAEHRVNGGDFFNEETTANSTERCEHRNVTVQNQNQGCEQAEENSSATGFSSAPSDKPKTEKTTFFKQSYAQKWLSSADSNNSYWTPHHLRGWIHSQEFKRQEEMKNDSQQNNGSNTNDKQSFWDSPAETIVSPKGPFFPSLYPLENKRMQSNSGVQKSNESKYEDRRDHSHTANSSTHSGSYISSFTNAQGSTDHSNSYIAPHTSPYSAAFRNPYSVAYNGDAIVTSASAFTTSHGNMYTGTPASTYNNARITEYNRLSTEGFTSENPHAFTSASHTFGAVHNSSFPTPTHVGNYNPMHSNAYSAEHNGEYSYSAHPGTYLGNSATYHPSNIGSYDTEPASIYNSDEYNSNHIGAYGSENPNAYNLERINSYVEEPLDMFHDEHVGEYSAGNVNSYLEHSGAYNSERSGIYSGGNAAAYSTGQVTSYNAGPTLPSSGRQTAGYSNAQPAEYSNMQAMGYSDGHIEQTSSYNPRHMNSIGIGQSGPYNVDQPSAYSASADHAASYGSELSSMYSSEHTGTYNAEHDPARLGSYTSSHPPNTYNFVPASLYRTGPNNAFNSRQTSLFSSGQTGPHSLGQTSSHSSRQSGSHSFEQLGLYNSGHSGSYSSEQTDSFAGTRSSVYSVGNISSYSGGQNNSYGIGLAGLYGAAQNGGIYGGGHANDVYGNALVGGINGIGQTRDNSYGQASSTNLACQIGINSIGHIGGNNSSGPMGDTNSVGQIGGTNTNRQNEVSDSSLQSDSTYNAGQCSGGYIARYPGGNFGGGQSGGACGGGSGGLSGGSSGGGSGQSGGAYSGGQSGSGHTGGTYNSGYTGNTHGSGHTGGPHDSRHTGGSHDSRHNDGPHDSGDTGEFYKSGDTGGLRNSEKTVKPQDSRQNGDMCNFGNTDFTFVCRETNGMYDSEQTSIQRDGQDVITPRDEQAFPQTSAFFADVDTYSRDNECVTANSTIYRAVKPHLKASPLNKLITPVPTKVFSTGAGASTFMSAYSSAPNGNFLNSVVRPHSEELDTNYHMQTQPDPQFGYTPYDTCVEYGIHVNAEKCFGYKNIPVDCCHNSLSYVPRSIFYGGTQVNFPACEMPFSNDYDKICSIPNEILGAFPSQAPIEDNEVIQDNSQLITRVCVMPSGEECGVQCAVRRNLIPPKYPLVNILPSTTDVSPVTLPHKITENIQNTEPVTLNYQAADSVSLKDVSTNFMPGAAMNQVTGFPVTQLIPDDANDRSSSCAHHAVPTPMRQVDPVPLNQITATSTDLITTAATTCMVSGPVIHVTTSSTNPLHAAVINHTILSPLNQKAEISTDSVAAGHTNQVNVSVIVNVIEVPKTVNNQSNSLPTHTQAPHFFGPPPRNTP